MRQSRWGGRWSPWRCCWCGGRDSGRPHPKPTIYEPSWPNEGMLSFELGTAIPAIAVFGWLIIMVRYWAKGLTIMSLVLALPYALYLAVSWSSNRLNVHRCYTDACPVYQDPGPWW